MNLRWLTKRRAHTVRPANEQLIASWQHFIANWRLFLSVGVVAEVVNVLINVLARDADVIKTLWFGLFVAPAIIWAVLHVKRSKRSSMDVKTAYYKASAAALPFFIILLLLTLFTVPFSLGAALFTVANMSFVTNTLEQIAVLLLWGLLAWPTAWLLIRYSMAMIEAVKGAQPVAALRKSYQLTRNNTKTLFFRHLVFGVLALMLLSIVTILVSVTGMPDALAAFIIESVLYLFVLPLGFLYHYHLYLDLQ